MIELEVLRLTIPAISSIQALVAVLAAFLTGVRICCSVQEVSFLPLELAFARVADFCEVWAAFIANICVRFATDTAFYRARNAACTLEL